MFCIRCGAEIPDDAKFCPVCGMKIPYDNSESENLTESVAAAKPCKEVSNPIDEKIVLTLGKRKLEYPATMKRYVKHYHHYLQVKVETCQNFTQEYSKLNVKSIEDVLGEVSSLVAKECAIVTKESFARLLAVNIRNYSFEIYLDYVLHFYNPEDAFEPFCERANEVVAQAQRISNYRMVQRASRGQWVGGGFGLKGAIKGAATAGALNAASGVFHGITDAVTNASDKAKLKKMMAVDEQQVQEYFKDVLRKYIDAVYNAERITLVQYGYLEEYNRDTSQADIILDNAKTVFQMTAGQGVETTMMAVYDCFNAEIDCIQLNPFDSSYYKEIYKYSMLMKLASQEYSRIMLDLFEFAQFFEMTEICKEYAKSANEDFAKPYLRRIQEQPKDAEEIYSEFQGEVRKLQKDNPFFTQEIIEYVKTIKYHVIEEYHEALKKNDEKENFKREYVKYCDMLSAGKIQELWKIANDNNAIVQYILLRYYIEEVLEDAITDIEIDNCKSEECILKEVEISGGNSDFAEFLEESILEKRNRSYPEIAEKHQKKMVALARKQHPCVSAVAYAGFLNINCGYYESGAEYLKKAIEDFSPVALAWYGNCLFTGENGISVDKEKARYYLEMAIFVGQDYAIKLNKKYSLGFVTYRSADGARIKTDERCFCNSDGKTTLVKFPSAILHRYYSRLLCGYKSICLNYGKELTDEQQVTKVKSSLLIPENEKIYFAVTANVMGTSKKDMSGLAIGTRGVYIRETGIIKKRRTYLWDDFKKVQIQNNKGVYIENYFLMVSPTIEKTMLHLLQDLQWLCKNPVEDVQPFEDDCDENLLDEELKSRNIIELSDTIPNGTEKSSAIRNDDGLLKVEEDFWEDADENELDKDMLTINEDRKVNSQEALSEKSVSNADVNPMNKKSLKFGEMIQTADVPKVPKTQQIKEKHCPSCQRMNKMAAKFCSGCGFAFEKETVCKQCGNKIKPGKKFCSACGAKVEN